MQALGLVLGRYFRVILALWDGDYARMWIWTSENITFFWALG
jgi:hypothetical protein